MQKETMKNIIRDQLKLMKYDSVDNFKKELNKNLSIIFKEFFPSFLILFTTYHWQENNSILKVSIYYNLMKHFSSTNRIDVELYKTDILFRA